MRGLRNALLCVCVAGTLPGQGIQRPPDQTAFLQARAVTEPVARLDALRQFIDANPGTALAKRAADLEFQTLLRSFPDRTAEISKLATAAVGSVPAGFERWTEEACLADLLAAAGPHGADLADAKLWAQGAVAALTEESYRRAMRATELRYKLPPLTPRQRQQEYARTRASFLAALANVDLRLGDQAGAERALAEAGRLEPLSSEVSSLRGQLALLGGQEQVALDDFEHAEAEGDLQEPWLATTVALYTKLHSTKPHRDSAAQDTVPPGPASDARAEMLPAGLEDSIDVLYAKLFPPPYQLSARSLPPGGHTVLLELFTGSGCEPCVAPDLAVESLLGTYGRQDLVVLEYDEHIPRPDPLANPDSVARATTYRVGTTPQAFLDGEEVPVGGASRADVENVVLGLADGIEDRAGDPAELRLQLTVTRAADGAVQAQGLVAPRASAPGVKLSTAGRAVLHLALVEDPVRYSGENGVRFHRMVVRAVAKAAVLELAGKPTGALAAVNFQPATVSREERQYLDDFEQSNDRFGEVRFRTKDIPLQANHLGVVAWVEDPSSHRVLQAAYAAVPPA